MACEPACKDWVDYFLVSTPLLIATFVAYIGYLQHRTNHDKLRLELYQRRFAVYEATLTYFHALSGDSESIGGDSFKAIQRTFIRGYRESQFLFDAKSGIFKLLGEIHTGSFRIIGFKQHGKAVASHPEALVKLSNESMEALNFIGTGVERLETALEQYLDFRRVLA